MTSLFRSLIIRMNAYLTESNSFERVEVKEASQTYYQVKDAFHHAEEIRIGLSYATFYNITTLVLITFFFFNFI
jgi:hypothetical protein